MSDKIKEFMVCVFFSSYLHSAGHQHGTRRMGIIAFLYMSAANIGERIQLVLCLELNSSAT